MKAPTFAVGSHVFGARNLVLHALPPVLFAGAYLFGGDMQLALDYLVVGAVISVASGAILERRLLALPLIMGCVGVATALLAATFHNPDILKLKAIAFHTLLGVTLLILVAARVDLLPRVFGEGLLTKRGWRRLMLLFGILSLATAAANALIWQTLPERDWVLFHFPISPLIHVAILATQIPWLKRDHAAAVTEQPHEKDGVDTPDTALRAEFGP